MYKFGSMHKFCTSSEHNPLNLSPLYSVPDDLKVSLKMKQLSLSLSELREEDHSTQRYNSLPRMQHSRYKPCVLLPPPPFTIIHPLTKSRYPPLNPSPSS